jgi:hypothetical protein
MRKNSSENREQKAELKLQIQKKEKKRKREASPLPDKKTDHLVENTQLANATKELLAFSGTHHRVLNGKRKENAQMAMVVPMSIQRN